ncbi:MAG: SDR family NAD(P)-dependent oxidoreductase [Haloarculaceae archaeon]
MDVDCYDSLAGQVALVTGATRGIGATVAEELTDLEATVYAGARDPDDVTADEQRPVRLDVTERSQIAAAIDRIAEETGRLDVVVNNAGVAGPDEPLHAMSVADFGGTMAVNARGPVLVTKFALPLLLDGDGGRVVNVSSGMGTLTDGMSGGSPAYRISKASVNGLTAYLHGEYGNEGLLANAACPGWVRTDMGGPGAPRSPAEGADTPVWLARFRPGSPGGRIWRDRRPIEW